MRGAKIRTIALAASLAVLCCARHPTPDEIRTVTEAMKTSPWFSAYFTVSEKLLEDFLNRMHAPPEIREIMMYEARYGVPECTAYRMLRKYPPEKIISMLNTLSPPRKIVKDFSEEFDRCSRKATERLKEQIAKL